MKKNEDKKLSKSNLPTKICAHCGEPMNWRKRWAKVLAEVKFCSECRRRGKNQTNSA